MALLLCLVGVSAIACTGPGTEGAPPAAAESAAPAEGSSSMPPYDPSPEELERDEIYSLLAYAVIFKDWQESSTDGRGYNIGSVLVDAEAEVVCWARNSVDVTANETQHGEVRLMTNYLNNTGHFSLKGYKLYTTLEPCAMCAGMMTMTSLYATIFGQTDPDFGDAMQRLEINSTSIGGYKPYPRPVISVPSTLAIREEIDQKYAARDRGVSMTEWLATSEAKALYQKAWDQLQSYSVQFGPNQPYLEGALAFLDKVPADYTAIPYTVGCDVAPSQ